MKVLNVNMSLDPVKGGGTVERTIQINRHLTALGVESSIAATDAGLYDPAVRALIANEVNVLLLRCVNERFYIPSFKLKKLVDLVRQVDVINIMGHWTVLNAIVYLLARRYNKPYTVCPAGALSVVGRSKTIKRLYNYIVGRRLIRGASAFIAIAPNELGQFADYGIGRDEITLLPNGINPGDYADEDIASFRRNFGIGEGAYILFVGRLNWIKGPDLLLKAFAESECYRQGVRLVFAGPDGGLLEELKETAQKLEVAEQVCFVGHISGADKSRAYHGASLVAVPSRLEAMSIVALEAGICGVPVLLTDQCGFDEVAQVSGGAVVPVDVKALATAMSSMMSAPERLKASGQRLRTHVAKNYLWSMVVRRYLELFKALC